MRGKLSGELLQLQDALQILMIAVLVVGSSRLCADIGGADAAPIGIPDLNKCELATDSTVVGPVVTIQFNCCLPVPSQPIAAFSFDNYKFPATKHIRRPAHKASEEYIAKYNKAYALMKALPDSDPRSFAFQARLHCAFCNNAYLQAGANGSVPLQVHFSWLFLPWHRWYLYFHERILAKLVGDPGFSLLYWNWDDQINGGNVLPDIFVRNGTAVYDAKRNPEHLPPTLVRLSTLSTTTDNSVVVNENLNAMYQSVVTASTAELFLGGAYRIGTDLTNVTVINSSLVIGGSLDDGVHNAIHYWTGDTRQLLLQNMGTLSTAARDPIFYAHHSNVDRLWNKWQLYLPGGPRADHTDPDFLDAEFLFYDENANPVKVKVRDALDSEKLGVSYKKVRADDLWVNYSPAAATSGSAVPAMKARGVPVIAAWPTNGKITLTTKLVGIVATPTGSKPSKTEEVLTIQGVELTRNSFVSLVVFVNLPGAGVDTNTDSAEYVGTFNIAPSTSKRKHLVTNVKFEIGDNLKRIGIQKEDEVVITVLVKGNETVSIQGIQIKYE